MLTLDYAPPLCLRPAVVLLILLPYAISCQLLGYFDQAPPERCDAPGRQEQLPCGPCLKGLQLRVCGENFLWRREGACLDNPYDVDQDGYANELCFEEEGEECCGEADCDDSEAARYPGHGDVDRDEHIDVRCGGDDCDDDNDSLWNGHADRDDDGHDDVRCGGDDCDDHNDERWNGHADVDGDGHTDLCCCTADTPLCDDCNDDDPRRWLNHADLDWDGRDDVMCCDREGTCGDDCDDAHPQRWMGHADVDGDGRVDDRCCPECDEDRLDCNDNDPRRWTGNADLDGDGYDEVHCRCGIDPNMDCSRNADCDDDCDTCHPGAPELVGEARDHDCNGVIDELQAPTCVPNFVEVVGSVDTGDSSAIFVTEHLVYVASVDGLYEVDVLTPSNPFIREHIDVGSARDVVVHGDVVYVATPAGLVVVDRSSSSGLVRIAGPIDTGDTRAVHHTGRGLYIGSYRGVFEFDVSSPTVPVEVANSGHQVIENVRDVDVENALVIVVTGATPRDHEAGLSLLYHRYGQLELSERIPIENATALAIDRYGLNLYVVAEDQVLALNRISSPVVIQTYEADNLTGIWTAPNHVQYVTSLDGLHVLHQNLNPYGMVPTGPARSVMTLDENAYLATPSGLVVVSLGCL